MFPYEPWRNDRPPGTFELPKLMPDMLPPWIAFELPKLTPDMAAPKDMGEPPRPLYEGRRKAVEVDILRAEGLEGFAGAGMGWGRCPAEVDMLDVWVWVCGCV